MTFAGMNYWAILLAAVAGWIAGAAWYMSLGKVWQAAVGMTTEQMAACRQRPYAWVPFVLVFCTNLAMAWTLAGILGHFGEVTIKDGIITGALCWFGFVITSLLVINAFAMRPYRLTAIDGGHYLLVLVLMGAIIGAMGVK
ncbi:MAG TPA: DUF1761 domain-containing protein [Xanthobacteraceae bacterium]